MNPLQPTPKGRQLPTCSAYLDSLVSKASSKRSSYVTNSFSSTACLADSDTKMVGHMMVAANWLVNFRCCSRSTNSCQSLAGVSISADALVGFRCSPALMAFLESWNLFPKSISALMASANGLQDWIMPPSVPSLSKWLCAAAEDIL